MVSKLSPVNIAALEHKTYRATIMKFYNPWSILLDILCDDEDEEEKEVEKTKGDAQKENTKDGDKHDKMIRKLTEHWTYNENDPFPGRKFDAGEVVCVTINNFWRPALIIEFDYIENLYKLVVLDSGQIIEVPRIDFRVMPDKFIVLPRYVFFGLMDLFPAKQNGREPMVWSTETCTHVRKLLSVTSSSLVVVMSRRKSHNCETFFGNLFISVAGQHIDLKNWLLDNGLAIEDPVKFEYFHNLKPRDQFELDKEEVPEKVEEPKKKAMEITDEFLEENLPEPLRVGGADPLKSSQRESFRCLLKGETCIAFGSASPPGKASGAVGYGPRGPKQKEKYEEEILNKQLYETYKISDSVKVERNSIQLVREQHIFEGSHTQDEICLEKKETKYFDLPPMVESEDDEPVGGEVLGAERISPFGRGRGLSLSGKTDILPDEEVFKNHEIDEISTDFKRRERSFSFEKQVDVSKTEKTDVSIDNTPKSIAMGRGRFLASIKIKTPDEKTVNVSDDLSLIPLGRGLSPALKPPTDISEVGNADERREHGTQNKSPVGKGKLNSLREEMMKSGFGCERGARTKFPVESRFPFLREETEKSEDT